MKFILFALFTSATVFAADYDPSYYGFRSSSDYSIFVDRQIRDSATRCTPCGEKIFCGDLNTETLNYCQSARLQNPALTELFKGKEKVRYRDLVEIYRKAKKTEIPLNKPIFLQPKQDYLRKNSNATYSNYLDQVSGSRNNVPVAKEKSIDVKPPIAIIPSPTPPMMAPTARPAAETFPLVDTAEKKTRSVVIHAPQMTIPNVKKLPAAPKEEVSSTQFVAAPKEDAPAAAKPSVFVDANCNPKSIKSYMQQDNFCECEIEKPMHIEPQLLKGCNQILGGKYENINECLDEMQCQGKSLLQFSNSRYDLMDKIGNLRNKIYRAKDCREELRKYVDSALNGKSDRLLFDFYAQEYVSGLSSKILPLKYSNLKNEEICDYIIPGKADICKGLIEAGGLDRLIERNKKVLSQFSKPVLKQIEKDVFARVAKVVPADNETCQSIVSDWYQQQQSKAEAAAMSLLVPLQKLSSCKLESKVTPENYKIKSNLFLNYPLNVLTYRLKSRNCNTQTNQSDLTKQPASADQ